jgi:transcriptional regulator with PAS, ATPase and Fis domain
MGTKAAALAQIPVFQHAGHVQTIIDQFSEGVVFYDRTLTITGVNAAAEKLLHIPAGEIVGRSCKDVFRCETCRHDCGLSLGLGLEPGNMNCSVRLTGVNGGERLAVVRTAQLKDGQGEIEGVAAFIGSVSNESPQPKIQVIAESAAMRAVLDFANQVALSEAVTILLEGENGTGKDLIAKAIHYHSVRRAEPFIAINCAAIPETLLESELFGYEKGAFTDARSQKRGIFELADKGTVFLDEIGEIPLVLQAKLLRVMEDQTFRRLGGLQDIHPDLRVIAATNKNLREAVRAGAFRQDLYFRLNVIQIGIPPLRERPQDILPLARAFIESYNHKFKRSIAGLSPGAENMLLAHTWPGNVRELRNAIERAMILETGSLISADRLPLSVVRQEWKPAAETAEPAETPNGMVSLEEQERTLIVRALEKTGGNQTRAARMLSITRDTLRYRMKKFDLR